MSKSGTTCRLPMEMTDIQFGSCEQANAHCNCWQLEHAMRSAIFAIKVVSSAQHNNVKTTSDMIPRKYDVLQENHTVTMWSSPTVLWPDQGELSLCPKMKSVKHCASHLQCNHDYDSVQIT